MPDEDRQQEFPFSREERFRILRGALGRLPEELLIGRTGDRDVVVRRGREHQLCRLMETLIVYSTQGECSRSRGELAELCRYSETTLRRQIEVAESLGWITVSRQGGARPNTIAINFAAMKSYRPQPAEVAQSIGPVGTDSGVHRSRGDQCNGPVGTDHRSRGDRCSIYVPSFPPSPPRESDPPPPPSWWMVVEALKSCGIAARQQAMMVARQRKGSSPEEILALIAHWRSKPGAWSKGMLKWRVQHHIPGDDVADDWPAESPEWRAKDTARQRLEDLQAAAAREAERTDEPRQDDVEAKHAAAIAAMTDDELDAVLQSLTGFERDYLIKRRALIRVPGAVRLMFAAALERRDHAESDVDPTQPKGEPTQ